jgi:hypothetical protein|tara:strand:- start:509 stop:661 length:153 start_codon:yes stop_codon:yes gene_type:complete
MPKFNPKRIAKPLATGANTEKIRNSISNLRITTAQIGYKKGKGSSYGLID